MEQGIQNKFTIESVRLYGCYFLSLLRFGEMLQHEKHLFTDQEIADFYYKYVKCGWLEADCFVVNPTAILRDVSNVVKNWEVAKATNTPTEDIFVTYLKRKASVPVNGVEPLGHFILQWNDGGKIITWDSCAIAQLWGKYQIDSYRVFT